MESALRIPRIKLKLMPEGAHTAITIDRNTFISIGLAMSLAGAFAFNEVRHANDVNIQQNNRSEIILLKSELREVKAGYVTKEELRHTMDLIQKDLSNISEKLGKKIN